MKPRGDLNSHIIICSRLPTIKIDLEAVNEGSGRDTCPSGVRVKCLSSPSSHALNISSYLSTIMLVGGFKF